MLMPIVSMNKMSMNESVAASCCWRYVLGVHEQYPEILHGGKIGTTYEVNLTLAEGFENMATGWLAMSSDLKKDYSHWSDYQLNFNPDAEQQWTFADGSNANPLEGLTGVYCPHDDASCLYYDEVPTYSQDMHIGATSAHANLKAWDEPHKAVQYSS